MVKISSFSPVLRTFTALSEPLLSTPMQTYIFHTMDKKQPVVITPYHWPDLDGIACAYALEHLMRQRGYQNVQAMIAETPQEEAAWVIRSLSLHFSKIEEWLPHKRGNEQVILVDTSDPKDLPSSFPLSQVRAIIDHRSYGDLSQFSEPCVWIDPVGSAATLIAELSLAENIRLDSLSAQLLYAAIESNTIRRSTQNTTERDQRMALYLQGESGCEESWIEQMFLAKSNVAGNHLYRRIDEDLSSKLQPIGPFATAVAQLEIIGVRKLFQERASELRSILGNLKENRKAQKIFLIGIDLQEKKTWLFFEDEEIKSIVTSKVNTNDKLLTRKEIIQRLIPK